MNKPQFYFQTDFPRYNFYVCNEENIGQNIINILYYCVYSSFPRYIFPGTQVQNSQQQMGNQEIHEHGAAPVKKLP